MKQTFQTISPIDNSVYVERDYSTEKDIDAALTRAQQAQQEWRKISLSQRKSICSAAVDALINIRQELAEEICWQMGRPIQYAGGEIDGLEERARCMIDLAEPGLQPTPLSDKPGFKRWIQHEPLGVVMVIAPWNYPYLTAINAIVPALLAGNSVILKHSIQTPLCAERLHQAFASAQLPAGVFQYLHLDHEHTKTTIQDSRINYIAFTGSVAGGVMVEQAVAGRFVGVGLELGGKDPAYIRADADLSQTVPTVMDGAFFNSGQSCCGIERIYVHASIYDDFLKQAVSWVKGLKLGPSNDPETTLGPLVKAGAADFVRSQIQQALDMGATPHIDPQDFELDVEGSPYLAPQLLTEVDHRMRVMSEESFGPVVGIQKVENDEQAIDYMNDSNYGLTAAIFTQDTETGIKLGQQLNTGTFFINRCDYLDPELAWSGVKHSGYGCSLSVLSYKYLTRPKSFHIKNTN